MSSSAHNLRHHHFSLLWNLPLHGDFLRNEDTVQLSTALLRATGLRSQNRSFNVSSRPRYGIVIVNTFPLPAADVALPILILLARAKQTSLTSDPRVRLSLLLLFYAPSLLCSHLSSSDRYPANKDVLHLIPNNPNPNYPDLQQGKKRYLKSRASHWYTTISWGATTIYLMPYRHVRRHALFLMASRNIPIYLLLYTYAAYHHAPGRHYITRRLFLLTQRHVAYME